MKVAVAKSRQICWISEVIACSIGLLISPILPFITTNMTNQMRD